MGIVLMMILGSWGSVVRLLRMVMLKRGVNVFFIFFVFVLVWFWMYKFRRLVWCIVYKVVCDVLFVLIINLVLRCFGCVLE